MLTRSSPGEANITIGAGRTGIIQMVSSNASLSYAQIASHRVSPAQPLFFQLYKHKTTAQAAQRVREVDALGYNAIFLTVDAPFPGNRERDVRAGWELDDIEKLAKQGKANNVVDGKGGAAKEMPRSDNDDLDNVDDADTTGTAGKLIANDDVDMTWHEVRSSPAARPWSSLNQS